MPGATNTPKILIRELDAKCDLMFQQTLEDSGIEPKCLPVGSPNLNARLERFVRAIKTECLDEFVAFGHDYLNYLVENIRRSL